MMTKMVDLGYCNTCGQKVDAGVDFELFISRSGELHKAVPVEGHCGVPGHSTKVSTVARGDLDKLPVFEPAVEYQY